ncbi:MAG: DUF3501 family protein [Xanthomonadales bacterium]|nr:DUF3501 family protein [Xanthomonadales bacterium]
MEKLSREDLMSLETYAEQRHDFRARVLEHKKHRRVDIGPNLTLYFEDRLTIQYQVQEMLRIERIFEADGINEELEAYNPLIPEGSNLKCTAMFEFTDVTERRRRLAELAGVENHIWLQVGELENVYAIANEDLDRSTDEKTSAVHFMRFELTAAMKGALAAGESLRFGVEHDLYRYEVTLNSETRSALLHDLSAE